MSVTFKRAARRRRARRARQRRRRHRGRARRPGGDNRHGQGRRGHRGTADRARTSSTKGLGHAADRRRRADLIRARDGSPDVVLCGDAGTSRCRSAGRRPKCETVDEGGRRRLVRGETALVHPSRRLRPAPARRHRFFDMRETVRIPVRSTIDATAGPCSSPATRTRSGARQRAIASRGPSRCARRLRRPRVAAPSPRARLPRLPGRGGRSLSGRDDRRRRVRLDRSAARQVEVQGALQLERAAEGHRLGDPDRCDGTHTTVLRARCASTISVATATCRRAGWSTWACPSRAPRRLGRWRALGSSPHGRPDDLRVGRRPRGVRALARHLLRPRRGRRPARARVRRRGHRRAPRARHDWWCEVMGGPADYTDARSAATSTCSPSIAAWRSRPSSGCVS